MIRGHFFISIILLISTVFLSLWFYRVWVKPMDMPVQKIHQVQNKEKSPAVKRGRVLDSKVYDSIVKKDLFRPSRTASPRADTAPNVLISTETPKLFGTVIMNDKKSAILEDPLTKTTKLYNINDSVAGFIVSEVYEDKVILLRGDEKVEVRLRDSKGIRSAPSQSGRQTQRPRTRRPKRGVTSPGTRRSRTPAKGSPINPKHPVPPGMPNFEGPG